MCSIIQLKRGEHMCLANNIRYLRRKNNLSQDDIAEKLGYKSYTTIQKWEMGISEPSISKLKALAEIFHVDINDMTTRNIEKDDQGLTKKDTKDIEQILDQTREQLLTQEGLMFDGDPASPEAIDSIISAMQIGMEMAKKKNKEKYTPKKYRKG